MSSCAFIKPSSFASPVTVIVGVAISVSKVNVVVSLAVFPLSSVTVAVTVTSPSVKPDRSASTLHVPSGF